MKEGSLVDGSLGDANECGQRRAMRLRFSRPVRVVCRTSPSSGPALGGLISTILTAVGNSDFISAELLKKITNNDAIGFWGEFGVKALGGLASVI